MGSMGIGTSDFFYFFFPLPLLSYLTSPGHRTGLCSCPGHPRALSHVAATGIPEASVAAPDQARSQAPRGGGGAGGGTLL